MSDNKSSNTVFVTVEQFQGVLEEVRVFKIFRSAEETEQKWLVMHGISDDISRECKAADGTEFHIFECQVED